MNTEQLDKGLEIISTKVPVEVAAQLKAFAEEKGMSSYEMMQLFVLSIASYIGWKRGVTPALSAELISMIETFQIDHEEVQKTLLSLRAAFGMKMPATNDIKYAIVVHKGGVVEVYDPTDTELSMTGSVTVSKEKALRVLLERGDRLPDIFRNVMADRKILSVYEAIIELFTEENRYLGMLDDEMLGYAQNEYGNVPKQKRNRQ